MTTAELEQTISKMAAEVNATHDNIEDAIDALAVALEVPHEWTTHPAWPAVRRGLREFLHDNRHQARGEAKRQLPLGSNGKPLPCDRNSAAGMAGVLDVAAQTFLEMQIGNSKFGDLTGEEIAEVGEREENIGRGHLRMGKFLGKVALKTPKAGLVRNSWSEVKLRKLWENTK